MRPSWHTTASTLRSRQASSWPSMTTTSTGSPATLPRVARSMGNEMSEAITRPDLPTREAASSASTPVPAATSSTVCPAVTRAAASSVDLNAWDHRPVSRS